MQTGPSQPWRITGKNCIGDALFMSGKMQRPDVFSWHWGSVPGRLIITGLWRGRPQYGTLTDTTLNILEALKANGCDKDVESICNAIDAQGERASEYYGLIRASSSTLRSPGGVSGAGSNRRVKAASKSGNASTAQRTSSTVSACVLI